MWDLLMGELHPSASEIYRTEFGTAPLAIHSDVGGRPARIVIWQDVALLGFRGSAAPWLGYHLRREHDYRQLKHDFVSAG